MESGDRKSCTSIVAPSASRKCSCDHVEKILRIKHTIKSRSTDINLLALPSKRYALNSWRESKNVLAPEMIEHLKGIVHGEYMGVNVANCKRQIKKKPVKKCKCPSKTIKSKTDNKKCCQGKGEGNNLCSLVSALLKKINTYDMTRESSLTCVIYNELCCLMDVDASKPREQKQRSLISMAKKFSIWINEMIEKRSATECDEAALAEAGEKELTDELLDCICNNKLGSRYTKPKREKKIKKKEPPSKKKKGGLGKGGLEKDGIQKYDSGKGDSGKGDSGKGGSEKEKKPNTTKPAKKKPSSVTKPEKQPVKPPEQPVKPTKFPEEPIKSEPELKQPPPEPKKPPPQPKAPTEPKKPPSQLKAPPEPKKPLPETPSLEEKKPPPEPKKPPQKPVVELKKPPEPDQSQISDDLKQKNKGKTMKLCVSSKLEKCKTFAPVENKCCYDSMYNELNAIDAIIPQDASFSPNQVAQFKQCAKILRCFSVTLEVWNQWFYDIVEEAQRKISSRAGTSDDIRAKIANDWSNFKNKLQSETLQWKYYNQFAQKLVNNMDHRCSCNSDSNERRLSSRKLRPVCASKSFL